MILGVLIVSAASLCVVLLATRLSVRWSNETIEILAVTRAELRPALVSAQHEARRAQGLRSQ